LRPAWATWRPDFKNKNKDKTKQKGAQANRNKAIILDKDNIT
jgi:hypothetical protein